MRLPVAFALAQTPEQKHVEAITAIDAKFWVANNECDTTAFPSIFTDDVELYHGCSNATACGKWGGSKSCDHGPAADRLRK